MNNHNIMDNIELDKEIKLIRESIDELKESDSKGALKLAEDDLSYYLSLLSN